MTTRAMTMALVMAIAGPGCTGSSIAGFSEDLVGTWEWVQSEGGIFHQIRTPETEGIVREVTFLSTGIVRVEENGVLVVETTWETAVAPQGTSHAGKPIVRYGQPTIGFEEQAFSFPAADSLVLDDGCCDAFVHTFHRIAP